MPTVLTSSLACSLLVLAGLASAQAEVYRWTDANGVVHYGDRPQDGHSRPVELPPLQVIPGAPAARPAPPAGAQVPAASAAPTTAAAARPAPVQPKLRVVAPTPDLVLHDTSRTIAVRVELDAPLPEGAALLYYLDGVAAQKPGTALAQTLVDVDRGTHLVDVGVVDAAGRVLYRTPPVIVHVMPPIKRPPIKR